MLTVEVLKSSITGLTDEQYASIATLSTNDENRVIGDRLRKVYDDIDKDVEAITGVKKSPEVKTYENIKSHLNAYKKKADDSDVTGVTEKLTAAESKVTELETQIKAGSGDKGLIDKLTKERDDANTLVSSLREGVTKSETEHKAELEAEVNKNEEYRVDSLLSNALANITFKDGVDKDVIEAMMVTARKKTFEAGKREFQDIDGVLRIIFRDENDNVIADPDDNLQNPLTASAMYIKSLGSIVDAGQKQKGGGGKGGAGGANTMDLSQATTKREATDIIAKNLAAKGLVSGSPEYTTAQMEAYKGLPADMPI